MKRSYEDILIAQRGLLARIAGSLKAWACNDRGDIPERIVIACHAFEEEDAALRIEMAHALAIEQKETIAKWCDVCKGYIYGQHMCLDGKVK